MAPSAHQQDFAAAAGDHLAAFGTSGMAYRSATLGLIPDLEMICVAGELEVRKTDGGRTLGYEIEIKVAKADVPQVTRNGDTVDVPAAWFDATSAAQLSETMVTARVAKVLGDRSTAAFWHLGLAQQRRASA